MIKKIWNDPVWSKVIAVGIVALMTLISTKLYSVSEGISFKEAFDKILEIKIAVVYVILALIRQSPTINRGDSDGGNSSLLSSWSREFLELKYLRSSLSNYR